MLNQETRYQPRGNLTNAGEKARTEVPRWLVCALILPVVESETIYSCMKPAAEKIPLPQIPQILQIRKCC